MGALQVQFGWCDQPGRIKDVSGFFLYSRKLSDDLASPIASCCSAGIFFKQNALREGSGIEPGCDMHPWNWGSRVEVPGNRNNALSP